MSYLFYGGDSDNKEERQAAGDWAGGGVDDKLQGRGTAGGGCQAEDEKETTERGEKMPSNATLSKEVQLG